MKVLGRENGNSIIEGAYGLSSLYKGIYLYRKYNILIKVPEIYTEKLPQVFNTDDNVPKEFEHFFEDGSLGLGSPMKLYLSAMENEISDYLIKNIDSYLYFVTYFIKYNEQFPYGERSNGLMGILEFWEEYLNTNDFKIIHSIMYYIS